MKDSKYTELQQRVIQSKVNNKYEILGVTTSLLNGLPAAVLVKARHTVVINSLGYDEHVNGMSWKLF